MESLIKAGAMDSFGNRASLLVAMPEIVAKINEIKKQTREGQASLFDDSFSNSAKIDFTIIDIDDFSKEEKLGFEKEFLGLYLTSHPHSDLLTKIKKIATHNLDFLEGEQEGIRIKVGGIVESVKKIFTKKSNSEMAFISISNEKGTTIECIVFPKVFERHKNLLSNDTVILIEGKLDNKNDKIIIIAETINSAKNLMD
jgi:DNA polymerase-3 subunit alpha